MTPDAVSTINATAEMIVAALSALVAILGTLAVLFKKLQSVLHELKPNSGGSMRDSVDRIERRLDAVESSVHAHLTESDAALKRVDENTRRLVALERARAVPPSPEA